MANFEGHLFWSFCGGVALAAVGLYVNHLHRLDAGGIVVLSMVGGSIPDIDYGRINFTDSKTGKTVERESKPFQIFTSFLSLGLSFLLLYYLKPIITNLSNGAKGALSEILSIPGVIVLIIIFVVFYATIRFLIKIMTVHRGVMHSIPFAILSAELAYLIFISDYPCRIFTSEMMPEYFTAAVFVGFISHLIVDEAYSIGWGSRNRTSYFGTAFTIYSKNSSLLANIILYSLIIALLFAINSKITAQSLLAMLISKN